MAVQQGSTAPVDKGSLPGFLHAALRSDLEVSGQAERPAILRRFQTIKTQRDAMQYMQEVQQKIGQRPASSSTT
jgi:phospholipase C